MDVLVLGGGYAGLMVTRKLERQLPEGANLTLVDDTGTHLVQHELHRAIRNPEYVDEISVPLADLFDRAELRQARVTGVDRERRTVSLDDAAGLSYDYCVIALGSETAYYGIPGVAAHSTPLKRLEHAAQIRREAEAVMDERSGDSDTPVSERGQIVVGGAGLSGIQVAGELAAMTREREVADEVDVVVLEQKATVAPGFPQAFQQAAREALDEQGVDVRTGTTVTGVDDREISTADGGEIPYDQFVWTGGIQGSEAMDGERPQVRGDLRLDDRTFALGDAVRIVDADGEPVPASASAAVRAAGTAAKNVVAAATADGGFVHIDQWNWESPGWLISVGDDAVAQLGPTVVTGAPANALKSAVGVTYLAEHGSLKRALGVLREDMGDTDGFSEFLQRF